MPWARFKKQHRGNHPRSFSGQVRLLTYCVSFWGILEVDSFDPARVYSIGNRAGASSPSSATLSEASGV